MDDKDIKGKLKHHDDIETKKTPGTRYFQQKCFVHVKYKMNTGIYLHMILCLKGYLSRVLKCNRENWFSIDEI